MIPSATIERFVGLPYRVQGRGYEAIDCWGLVWLWYRDVLGLDLPAYGGQTPTSADPAGLSELIAGEIPGAWIAVDQPCLHDVALLRRGRHLCHVGVVARPGLLLHAEGPGASVLEPVTSPLLRHRITGYWRHRALMELAPA